MPFDPVAMKIQAAQAEGEQVWVMDSPVGPIALHWQGAYTPDAAGSSGWLVRVDLVPQASNAEQQHDLVPASWLVESFDAYFQDPARRIEVPVRLAGTPFQRRVWGLIAAIPPGATRTYGDLAADLGSSARAVGGACRANPCPLVVPCHRVVARHGLGGFAGDRDGRLLDIKRWLLGHERASRRA